MEADAALSEDLLTSSRWSLGAERRMPWTSSLYFLPGGRIGGYSSPNEVYWSLEGGVLRIFRASRQEMWRFEKFDLGDGGFEATGTFKPEAGTEEFCQLREVEKRRQVVLTKEELGAVRWSLGEEGKVPWSSSLYFLPGGRIGGYSSPNEVSWSLEGAVLRIFRQNREEMWRFDEVDLVDGKLHATGRFQAEAGMEAFCRLKEVEKRRKVAPTQEELTGSRWSLGAEASSPWSSSLYFLADGRIGGYKSPNEVYWKLQDTVLRIFTGARQEMWRFDQLEMVDGTLQGVGQFQAEPGVEEFCRLKQLEKRWRVSPTQDDLTKGQWSLAAEGAEPWTSSLRFLPDGRIGGYTSPNEVFWSLENAVLRIFRGTGEEMWRFDEMELVDSRLEAMGSFQAEPGVDDLCRLKAVVEPDVAVAASEVAATDELLVGSRWSLAEEGEEPLSSSVYFLRNGRIGGYSSPNETYWRVEDSVLRIFSGAREETWHFGMFEMVGGKLRAVGRSSRDDEREAFCLLIQQSQFGSSADDEV